MSKERKRIIIVEDEALIADHIEATLVDAGFDVCGLFDNSDDLFAFLQKNKADLILLDINLEGSIDGVDIAHQVNKLYQVPIVFLTSNTDKHTVDRVKLTSPVGFVAKPYTASELTGNVEIALFKAGEQKNNTVAVNEEKSIFIKDKNALVKVVYHDIIYVEAMDNYAILYVNDKKHIVPHTLKSLCDLLEPEGFIKTHRSYLVNSKKITAIHPKSVLIGNKEIPLSENFRSEVISGFKTL
ncbi:MAG TPA: response regulator [Bacteroidia bacterium]